MDANGARELARRLGDHAERVEVRPEPLKAADAAPIFHWLGIEPPQAADADEASDGSPNMRRR